MNDYINTEYPNKKPTSKPTERPTLRPTSKPTLRPTLRPSLADVTTSEPTTEPTIEPTVEPTKKPIVTMRPTSNPISELSSFCGVAFISPNSIALINIGTGDIIAERSVNYMSESIAVDKINNEIYVIADGNHPLYKYDISLKNETNIGITNIEPLGLDFNELDGMLYGTFGTNIFKIDPLTGNSTDIGDNDASFETAILVNKNGNDVFIMDWGNTVLTNNTLINPTLSSTTIINWTLPPGQTTGPDTLDYLNDDPNDNNLVMCWGFDHPLECYIYNLDSQTYIEILSNTNLLIRGLEILPETMCTSLTVSPTMSPAVMTIEPTTKAPTMVTVSPSTQPTMNPTTLEPTKSPITTTTEAPTDSTPVPTSVTPSPTDDTPAPTDATPVPTSVTSSPTDDTMAPTSVTPVPTAVTPSPTDDTPAPSESTTVPTSITPAPTDSTPVPTSVTPSPTDDTMAPTSVTPGPTAITQPPTGYTSSPTIKPTDEPTNEPTNEPTMATMSPAEPGTLFSCEWRDITTGEIVRQQIINPFLNETCDFSVPPELSGQLLTFILNPYN